MAYFFVVNKHRLCVFGECGDVGLMLITSK